MIKTSKFQEKLKELTILSMGIKNGIYKEFLTSSRFLKHYTEYVLDYDDFSDSKTILQALGYARKQDIILYSLKNAQYLVYNDDCETDPLRICYNGKQFGRVLLAESTC